MPLETVTTGGNGRAEIWGAKAADTPGTFEILVTARKDGVEATAVIGQSIVLPSSTARAAGGKKWIWLVLVAAGGAAAAAVSAGGGGKSSAAPPPSSGGILNPNVPRIPGAQIGLPSIVIGAP